MNIFVSIIALLLVPLELRCRPTTPQRSPMSCFVVFDDLNNRLGCYGDPIAKSPILDRLPCAEPYSRGLTASSLICGPSRASFMSGRRPDSLGIWSIYEHLVDLHPDACHHSAVVHAARLHGHEHRQGARRLQSGALQKTQRMGSSHRRENEGLVRDAGWRAGLPPNLAKDLLGEDSGDAPMRRAFIPVLGPNLADH